MNKEIGKQTIKVLLALINAYYDKSNGYSHVSLSELNQRYGLAKNNLSKMCQQLCDEGWIEDCTINGFYKRFKIIKEYKCPEFILWNNLTNNQKNYILVCLDNKIDHTMSQKAIARIIYNTESSSNVSRAFTKIQNSCGQHIFDILNSITYVEGLVPENSIYTDNGYRTLQVKPTYMPKTEDEEIANFLIKKSRNRYKKATHVEGYNLSESDIIDILNRQKFKDYYTGIKPDNWKDYSIDRIDSSKGYVKDNIVITTNVINIMKNNLSIEEFKDQIKLLYNNISNF